MKLRNIVGVLLGLFVISGCSKEEVNSVDESQVKRVEDFTDPRDGHVYRCVQIGNQIWMMDNLNYFLEGGVTQGCYTWGQSKFTLDNYTLSQSAFCTVYDHLTDREEYQDYKDYISFYTSGSYSQENFIKVFEYWDNQFYLDILAAVQEYIAQLPVSNYTYYETSVNNYYSSRYGLLYSLDAARKAVPDGWRLPSDADWMKLETTLGMPEAEITEFNSWRGEGCGTCLLPGGISQFEAQMGGCDAYTAVDYEWIRKDECGYYWTNDEWTEDISTSSTSESDSSESDDDDSAQSVVREAMIRQVAIFSTRIWRGSSRVNNKDRDVAYSVRCVKDVK